MCLDQSGKEIETLTNIGASVVAMSYAHQFRRAVADDNQYPAPILSIARSNTLDSLHSVRDRLGLKDSDLSATMLFMFAMKKRINYYLIGDGVMAYRIRYTNDWNVMSFDFESGMPYYLRYELNPNSLSAYYGDAKYCDVHKEGFVTNNGTITRRWTPCKMSYPKSNPPGVFGFHFINEVDAVCMFSDGIHSFQRINPETGAAEHLHAEDVIHRFLDFKNYRGQFVQRRAKHTLADLAKEGFKPSDDFSMTAIYSEQPDA